MECGLMNLLIWLKACANTDFLEWLSQIKLKIYVQALLKATLLYITCGIQCCTHTLFLLHMTHCRPCHWDTHRGKHQHSATVTEIWFKTCTCPWNRAENKTNSVSEKVSVCNIWDLCNTTENQTFLLLWGNLAYWRLFWDGCQLTPFLLFCTQKGGQGILFSVPWKCRLSY